MNNTQIAPASPIATQSSSSPTQQYAALLAELLSLKSQGNACLTTYYLPGRKELLRILGCVYDELIKVEQSTDPETTYSRLRGYLKNNGITVHADTPNSGVLLRLVFPTLDPSRLSKFGRAMEAARAKHVKPGGLAAFIAAAGGIEKIRVTMVQVYATEPEVGDGHSAKSKDTSAEAIADPIDYDEQALDFGDELWALLSKRKAHPLLSLTPASAEALAGLEESPTGQIVLIAEIHNGQLHVLEQVPFVEGAIVSALQSQFDSSEAFVEASNKRHASMSPIGSEATPEAQQPSGCEEALHSETLAV